MKTAGVSPVMFDGNASMQRISRYYQTRSTTEYVSPEVLSARKQRAHLLMGSCFLTGLAGAAVYLVCLIKRHPF